VLGGSVRPGDEIVVLPSGLRGHVERIVTYEGDLDRAVAGQAVTLTLAEAIDVARGDLIADANRPPHMADQFAAHLVWMHEAPMLPGRPYLNAARNHHADGDRKRAQASARHKHRYARAAKQLAINEIGFANLSLDRAMPFDTYGENRETGSFVLIDRISNATVGAGMIRFRCAARRTSAGTNSPSTGARSRSRDIAGRSVVHRALRLGKSTIADNVEKRLLALGRHTYTLDGDNVRHGLNRDLGFTDADRVENIRRVIETAHLIADAGLIVLVSFISPFRAERRAGARAPEKPTSSSRSSSTRRSPSANDAIPKASTARRGRAS